MNVSQPFLLSNIDTAGGGGIALNADGTLCAKAGGATAVGCTYTL
jgi:hypothetical protein